MSKLLPSYFLILFVLILFTVTSHVSCEWLQQGGNPMQTHSSPSFGTGSGSEVNMNSNNKMNAPSPSLSSSVQFNVSYPSVITINASPYSPCGGNIWTMMSEHPELNIPNPPKFPNGLFLIGMSPIDGTVVYNITVPPTWGVRSELLCDDISFYFTTYSQGIGASNYTGTIIAVNIPTSSDMIKSSHAVLVDPTGRLPPSKHLLDVYHDTDITARSILWSYSALSSESWSASGNIQIFKTGTSGKNIIFCQYNYTSTFIDSTTGKIVSTFDIHLYVNFKYTVSATINNPWGIQWSDTGYIEIFIIAYSPLAPIPIVINYQYDPKSSTFMSPMSFSMSLWIPNSYPTPSSSNTWGYNGAVSSPLPGNLDTRMIYFFIYYPNSQFHNVECIVAVGKNRMLPEWVYTPQEPVYPYDGAVGQIYSGSPFLLYLDPNSGVPFRLYYMERTLSEFIDECDAPSNTSILSIIALDLLPGSGMGNSSFKIPLSNEWSECGYSVIVFTLSQPTPSNVFVRWNSLFTGSGSGRLVPPFGASYWNIDGLFGSYSTGLYERGWTYLNDSPLWVSTGTSNEVVSYETCQNYEYRFSSNFMGIKWMF
ncbi:MAG: hypothetical protein Sylvanvirus5_4 [Sylvanvirus sp.]|uniref:Uncharacterized protein n=1 Tax=Sylvanvirus sp. TaxID=2487774 RepID=A0A3G5AHK7_9VIRU|nr:MAG: hypothetical protein Sylvanvirus5_4 [Sylvanvirus sp.]